MVFVTADSCRAQLEQLTKMLVGAFPGSTIYQHSDLFRMSHDVLSHKVDVVLMEAEMGERNGLDLIQKLHRQRPDVPVFVIAKTNRLYEKAVEAGAKGYFVLPEGEQLLLDAIRLI